ncbi:glycosyltransferase family 4 protein [Flavobacterium sp.]|uniref:glycosyltransferase family 4 protein n=1 Tax=Flavobacterium sp. TaxID=239 RepID=UPI0035295E16
MQNKTKIFIDCHVFDHGFQGTRTYIEGVYKEMIKMNPDIEFYFAACNIDNLKKCFGEEPNAHYVQYTSKSKFFRLLIDIPRLIQKNKIDFAHFQYIVPPVKRCKYIVTIHDVLFIDFKQYFSFKKRMVNSVLYFLSSKISDIIVTVSDYSKEKIQQHFSSKNVLVTANAVAEEFYEDYDKEKIKRKLYLKYQLNNYIIYVSRWEPRKNHELILNSFLNLKLFEKDFKLVFVGDVSNTNPNFEKIFNNLPIAVQNKILFLKKVEHKDLIQLVQGATISVYPSKAEGFGIPALESVAAKIPTLISNKTAMSDFSFMSQYSFNPYKQDEFDELLLHTLENKDRIDLFSLQKSCKEKYSWTHAAKTLTKALKN